MSYLFRFALALSAFAGFASACSAPLDAGEPTDATGTEDPVAELGSEVVRARSTPTLPAIRITGRRHRDARGVLTASETDLVTSSFAQRGPSRWGDYSSMQVDPVDDCTFWYTNEYVASGAESAFGFGRWATRITSFRFADDACRSSVERPLHSAERAKLTVLLDFAGVDFTGLLFPPDPVGDVGVSHFVQAVNAAGGAVYAAFDKRSGARVMGPKPLHDWAPGGSACSHGVGDPIVLWDAFARRWVLSEVSTAGTLCIYLSDTRDPSTSPFRLYEFETPEFPDYEKLAVHTTTCGQSAYIGTAAGVPPAVYAFDRKAMLAGKPAGFQHFNVEPLSGFDFQSLTPSDLDGPLALPCGAPAIFMRQRDDELHSPATADPRRDFLDLYSWTIDFANSKRSRLSGPVSIPVAEFDSSLCSETRAPCLRQPKVATGLDAIPEVLMWRLPRRNFGSYEAIVGNFTTRVDAEDHAQIRWFELRKQRFGEFRLEQEGSSATDPQNRWLGSIAMDGAGDIALGYSAVLSTSPRSDPYEPNDTTDTAKQIECGFRSESAAIEQNADVDYYSLATTPGQHITIDIDARTDSSLLDAILVATDDSGAFIGFNDDASPPDQLPSADPYLELSAPSTGGLRFFVRAFASDGSLFGHGPYTVSVSCTAPERGR